MISYVREMPRGEAEHMGLCSYCARKRGIGMSLFFCFGDRCVAGSQNKKYQPGGIDCGCGSSGMAVCVLEGRVLEEIVPAMIPGLHFCS